ncbi:LysE family translocator [Salinibacterium sp. ZJ454]|uniref:LysE family translocator n=1 Tax=Salinibacterium sp. ZJ454 TaxID=2708339 RepID=UPI00141EBC00|nr:LysE family translocator [Salinibacterium sp. ZJ454]
MTTAAFLAFCGLGLVLALTPGPDSFLTLRYSLRGLRPGIAAGVGAAIGQLGWALLVGVGLAAIIEQSAEVYQVIKVIGGLYLIFLGIQAFRSHRAKGGADAAAPVPATSAWRAFAAGLLSNLTNPKVGLFFLAVVPQFLPQGASAFWMTMLLGATLTVIGGLYLVLLALVAAKANAWLNRPRVSLTLERSSGGILAALGVGTIASAAQA